MPDTKTRLLAAVKNGDTEVKFSPNVSAHVVPTGDFYRVEVSGDQPEGFKWDESTELAWWEGALIEDAIAKIDAALKGKPAKGEKKEIEVTIKAKGMSLTDLIGITKPFDKVSDAPANVQELDGAKLTLAQVNWIANVADGLKGKKDIDSPWAVAIGQFKQSFKKEDGKWVKKKPAAEEKELLDLAKSAVETLRRSSQEAFDSLVGVLIAEKEVSLDASLQQVRNAFYAEFGPKETAVEQQSPYVSHDGVFPDHVIVEEGGKLYKVPYTSVLGGITFADKSKWQQVVHTYTPVVPVGEVTLEKEPTMKMAVAVAKAMLKRQKSTTTVWKEGDERYYMALISMAIFDEENQIVEKEGMDFSIALAQKHDYKSGMYIRHVVPKSLVGRCMYERRIGPYWVEVGKFLNAPLAERTFEILEKDTEGKWRLSIGFITTKDQAKRGRYTRLLKYDTTITDRPALPVTAILAIGGKSEMDDIAKLLTYLNPQTDEEKEKDLAMLGDLFELGEKELTAIVKEVEQMQALRKALDEAGIEDEDVRAKIIAAVDEEPPAGEPPVVEPGGGGSGEQDLSQQIQDAVTAAMTEVAERLAGIDERLVGVEQHPGAADAVKEITKLLKTRSQGLPKPTESAPVVPGVSELVDKIDKHIGQKSGPKHPLAGFAGGPGSEEGG